MVIIKVGLHKSILLYTPSDEGLPHHYIIRLTIEYSNLPISILNNKYEYYASRKSLDS